MDQTARSPALKPGFETRRSLAVGLKSRTVLFSQEEQIQHPHGEAVGDAEHADQPDRDSRKAAGGAGELPDPGC